jgi:beta-galactosidase
MTGEEMIKRLSGAWLFSLQNEAERTVPPVKELWDRGYDDSSWKKVTVPHDWAVEFPFSRSHSSGTAYLPGGTGWYRYHFKTTEEFVDKYVELFFGGVYKRCKVWCNSYYLGSWKNGYTSFSFDITQQLKPAGEDNCIVVNVNHTDIADSRWYTGSGIMRPVYLKVSGLQHFTDDGVFFSSQNNEINIQSQIQNEASCAGEYTVTAQLRNDSGEVVFTRTQSLTIAAGGKTSAVFSGTVDNPVLWSVDNPYLYTLTVTVSAGAEVSDVDERKVGLRTIVFDKDRGFFCNGKSYKLKGVCVHEDAGCLGNAVPSDVWEYRLRKLKTAGCNAIRMSHNPHSEKLYDLCDELGFFVMDEVFDEWENPKNKWWQGHNVYPPSHQGYYEDFPECYKKDIRSFVMARRNHACVVLWSIGNEIDYPNDPYCSSKFKEMVGNNDKSKPAAEQQYNPDHPDIKRLSVIAKMLADEVRKNDVTHPVTMAIAFPELSGSDELFGCLDVIGYNYKEQFYANDHERYPEKPFIGSENSHGYTQWKAAADNEYISGQFLWTGIDYLGEAKGWPVHASPAGILDMAGYEKTEYYFRRSLWSDEPFVYVAVSLHGQNVFLHNWNYITGEQVDVRVYTNAPVARLILNGKVYADGRKNEEGYIEFTLPFENGILGAEISDTVRDEIATAQAACRMKTILHNGREMHFIEVHMVDDFDNEVVTDSSLVSVTVEGAGILAGIENGDIADVTEYSAGYRHVYNGRYIAYIRPTGYGEITVRFDSAGKKSGTVTFKSSK